MVSAITRFNATDTDWGVLACQSDFGRQTVAPFGCDHSGSLLSSAAFDLPQRGRPRLARNPGDVLPAEAGADAGELTWCHTT